MKKIRTILIWIFCLTRTIVFCQNKTENKIILSAPRDLYTYTPNEKQDYFGLFFVRDIFETKQEFRFKKIDLTKYYVKPYQVDYLKVKSDSLLFVFSGLKISSTKFFGLRPIGDFLLPGQTFTFELNGASYLLYVKGEIIDSKDSSSIESIESINNYRIGIRSKINGKVIDQVLEKRKLTRWLPGQYLGGIKVEWIGDYNGDGKLDIILMDVGHSECWDLILLEQDNQNRFKEIYRMTNCS